MVRTSPRSVISRNGSAPHPNAPATARSTMPPGEMSPPSPNSRGATLREAFPTCPGDLDLTRPVEYPREIEF